MSKIADVGLSAAPELVTRASGDILIQQRPLVISRDCALAKQTLQGESRTWAARCVSRDAGSLVSVGKPAGRSAARSLANGSSGAQCTHEHTGTPRARTVRSRCVSRWVATAGWAGGYGGLGI